MGRKKRKFPGAGYLPLNCFLRRSFCALDMPLKAPDRLSFRFADSDMFFIDLICPPVTRPADFPIEVYDGNPDSHACALRRSMDLCGIDPGNVILLATRSFSAEEVRFIRDREIRVISAADWIAGSPQDLAGTIGAQMEGRSAVYLAVDIDGFDAAFAPGTGYPMPGGISPESFFRLLEELVPRISLRALDLTEIAPPLDTNDVTAFLGVQVVLEVLGLVGCAEA